LVTAVLGVTVLTLLTGLTVLLLQAAASTRVAAAPSRRTANVEPDNVAPNMVTSSVDRLRVTSQWALWITYAAPFGFIAGSSWRMTKGPIT